MTDLKRLKNIETRIAMQVCSVTGYVTREEIEARELLRIKTNKVYDAINNKFEPYFYDQEGPDQILDLNDHFND